MMEPQDDDVAHTTWARENNGAKCRRHTWVRYDIGNGHDGFECSRCHKVRDLALPRQSKRVTAPSAALSAPDAAPSSEVATAAGRALLDDYAPAPGDAETPEDRELAHDDWRTRARLRERIIAIEREAATQATEKIAALTEALASVTATLIANGDALADLVPPDAIERRLWERKSQEASDAASPNLNVTKDRPT